MQKQRLPPMSHYFLPFRIGSELSWRNAAVAVAEITQISRLYANAMWCCGGIRVKGLGFFTPRFKATGSECALCFHKSSFSLVFFCDSLKYLTLTHAVLFIMLLFNFFCFAARVMLQSVPLCRLVAKCH